MIMVNTYYDKNWVFKGQMIISGGSKVEIQMVRENLLNDIYEAGRVYDINKKITFDVSDDRALYQLGWKNISIIGQVEQVTVESTRTFFLLKHVNDKEIEK
ncbi:MAG: hypothetical protein JEZ06_01470 [Anaerolineaceae bacterium]|nr:hypothetical protein [Anaerolineaceae bacterium]